MENLVFEQIPSSEDIFHDFDIHPIRGYTGYYRIRTGKYRIGCRITGNGQIVFYRVKSHEEIYRVFP